MPGLYLRAMLLNATLIHLELCSEVKFQQLLYVTSSQTPSSLTCCREWRR